MEASACFLQIIIILFNKSVLKAYDMPDTLANKEKPSLQTEV